MAGSINQVLLLGNVGADPKIYTDSNGNKVMTLSLATSDKFSDKTTGEVKTFTEWHRIVIFNKNLIPIAENLIQKGSRILVMGELRTRKWQNQQGLDVYTTEVIIPAFKGTLLCISNLKRTNEEPPVPENPYSSVPAQGLDTKSLDETFDAASNLMANSNDDIPF